ncbi:MAG: hypothetical protein DSZ29_01550 [Aquificaceae bacterium]|nr:MAG: hypothetical protein DSZ29_01550 [Aquificaceae bacterium]
MTYLIAQIWGYLFITACIAGITGWLLRDDGKKKLQELDQKWQENYTSVDNERKNYADKVKKMSEIENKNNELELKILLQKSSLEQAVQQLNKLQSKEQEVS